MRYRSFIVTTPFDLNDVCAGDGMLFVRDGVGIAARGVASQHSSQSIETELSALTSHPLSTEHRPIALGLIPFLPDNEGQFFIPRVTFRKHSDGMHTVTLIGHDDSQLSDDALQVELSSVRPHKPPMTTNAFEVRPITPIATYLQAVTTARDAVKNKQLSKAVIARDIQITAEHPMDVHGILIRLRASFGSSYRFKVGTMIGASPELLVEVQDRTVRSHPLAGTAPRTGDPDTDARLAAELINSTKNQIEHRVVIDMVHDTLLPYCSYLDWEAEPSIVTVANVQHLGTAIEGALTEPRPHVLELASLLCPTPALGGSPRKEALDLITQHEGFVRGNYGGAVGWIDQSGDGAFAVTIRCAELSDDNRSARLFAGGGIVAESEPHSELAETQAKFQAMLSAIVRP